MTRVNKWTTREPFCVLTPFVFVPPSPVLCVGTEHQLHNFTRCPSKSYLSGNGSRSGASATAMRPLTTVRFGKRLFTTGCDSRFWRSVLCWQNNPNVLPITCSFTARSTVSPIVTRSVLKFQSTLRLLTLLMNVRFLR